MTDPSAPDAAAPAGEVSTPRRGWVRRHRPLTAFLVLVLIAVLLLGGFLWVVNNKLGDIPRLDLGKDPDGQSVLTEPSEDGINFLLVGVDNGDSSGPSIREMTSSGDWQPGKFRSDTIMLLHLDEQRGQAYVISFPRDSWVDIPGRGKAKINAAFSYGGPALLVQTLKGLGLDQVHHFVAIDWDGFKDLTTKLGGVTVEVDKPFSYSGYSWKAGPNKLMGEEALDFVRARKTLLRGDFDRIQNQQRFLRAVMEKVLGGGLLSSPSRMLSTIDWAGKDVVVDKGLTSGRMRSLAVRLRDMRPEDFHFYTAPNNGTGTAGAASIVVLDVATTRQLFGSVNEDEVGAWIEDHGDDLDKVGD